MDQKSAGIKAAPAPAPSRAFALWMALLVLYFLLLPSAAQAPDSGGGGSAGEVVPAATVPTLETRAPAFLG